MIHLKHILHPTDFSDNSSQALKYACSLATQYHAELHLLHVIQDAGWMIPAVAMSFPDDYYEKQKQYAQEELASLPDKILSHTGSVTRNSYEGSPYVKIVQYAKEHAIDMIVMSTHGHSGIEHLVMGSVAENVVRTAPCPV
ncbi:MAG: universal stress protein, partial [Gammaproteobacteria bacterium]